jgi:hypothetical protein
VLPGGITGPPCFWETYGDLALQVGGVSNETVKYGQSSAGLGPQRQQKGNPVPGGITGPPCSWEGGGGYKYGDLALQVEGVSDGTIVYGYGSCATNQ